MSTDALGKAKALLKFGTQAMWAMRLEEAQGAFQQAADLARSAKQARMHARALAHLLWAMGHQGRAGELKPVIAQAGMDNIAQGGDEIAGLILMSCFLRFLPPDDPETATRVQGFVKEAELFPRDPDVARACGQVALVCNALGDAALAASLLERALPALEATLGAKHPEVGLMLYNLADLRASMDGYRSFGNFEPQFRRAIAIQDAALAPGHPERVAPMMTTGLMLARTGRHDEGRSLLERALSIAVAIEGDEGQTPQMVRTALAELESAQADGATEPSLLEAVRAAERDPGATPMDVAMKLTALCRHYFGHRVAGKAEPHYRKLRTISDQLGDLEQSVLRAEMGIPGKIYILLREGRQADAENILMGELEVMQRLLPEGHGDLLQHMYFTGNVYRMMDRHRDALRLFERIATAERNRDEADPGRADGLARLLDAQLEVGDAKGAERTAAEIERLMGRRPVMDPALNEITRQLQSVWHALQLEEHPDLVGSAARGDTSAGLVVGLCFAGGLGVSPSLDKARPWFEAAAKAGNTAAIEIVQAIRGGADLPVQINHIAHFAQAWLEESPKP